MNTRKKNENVKSFFLNLNNFSPFLLPISTPPSRIKNFKLPGLDKYTPEQLFYVSYARTWCGKMRPDLLVRLLQIDNHAPFMWRINGVVQNSPDFAKAFGCKAGSAMNPVKKCEVW